MLHSNAVATVGARSSRSHRAGRPQGTAVDVTFAGLTAVITTICIAPDGSRAIFSRSCTQAVSLLSQHCPGSPRSITKDGTESLLKGLDLLCVPLLILHSIAATTARILGPGHHGSITTDGRKSIADDIAVSIMTSIAPGRRRLLTKADLATKTADEG